MLLFILIGLPNVEKQVAKCCQMLTKSTGKIIEKSGKIVNPGERERKRPWDRIWVLRRLHSPTVLSPCKLFPKSNPFLLKRSAGIHREKTLGSWGKKAMSAITF